MDDALTSECQLEAHLWHLVVQSRAEAQPVFRFYRNYYTGLPDVGEKPFANSCTGTDRVFLVAQCEDKGASRLVLPTRGDPE